MAQGKDGSRAEARGLYHETIVTAARRGRGTGRLEAPSASVELDNPLCGDRVAVDVHTESSRLRAVAHRVRGCLLCEAAASVVAANAIGASAAELGRVADRLAEALAHGFAGVDLPWPELAMFAPVAAHRSRHRCVTLPFEALAAAMQRADRAS